MKLRLNRTVYIVHKMPVFHFLSCPENSSQVSIYKKDPNSEIQHLEWSLHLTCENLKWLLPAPYCSQKMA